MKDQIIKLRELAKQSEEIIKSLDKHVEELIIEWCEHERLRYSHGEYPTQVSSIDEWHIDNDGDVSFSWSETWAYGGYASGNDSFPSFYIYDTAAFEEFKKFCIKECGENKKRENHLEQQHKLAEYERLKKELNIN